MYCVTLVLLFSPVFLPKKKQKQKNNDFICIWKKFKCQSIWMAYNGQVASGDQDCYLESLNILV